MYIYNFNYDMPIWKITLLGYVALMTLVTFVIRGRDKWRATQEGWRVSEKNLLKLTLAGGGVGALAGMSFFRHKTIKASFLWKFWLILSIEVLIVGYILLAY